MTAHRCRIKSKAATGQAQGGAGLVRPIEFLTLLRRTRNKLHSTIVHGRMRWLYQWHSAPLYEQSDPMNAAVFKRSHHRRKLAHRLPTVEKAAGAGNGRGDRYAGITYGPCLKIPEHICLTGGRVWPIL